MDRKLRYGMVGGGQGAFIGEVHRKAAAINENVLLAAGCFSSNPEKNQASGAALGLVKDRVYDDFADMAAKEAALADGIDFVAIVTPNSTHYAIAKAFLEKGIHVMCEKPLCFTLEEAKELESLAAEKGLLFAVNYSYSGNNMLKEARGLVRGGLIGEIIGVNAEYLQEWLIGEISAEDRAMNTMPPWRQDPAVSGPSNCVGDIGTHIEHTVSYVTGLKIKRLLASMDYFGRPLDLNANIIVEYDNGAHGAYAVSQVCVGHMNGLVVRIFGTKGAVEWAQENADVLHVTLKGQPTQIYNRGMAYVSNKAATISRLPSGHAEGLYLAFANIYAAFTNAVAKTIEGIPLSEEDMDFPTVADGVAGVAFVGAAVKSARDGCVWVEVL